MIIDWLSFSCPRTEKNKNKIQNIYGQVDNWKNSFLQCKTRIQSRYDEGFIDVDMSSKALSFYEIKEIMQIIFIDDFHIRRLDLAYDDREGLLSMPIIWKHFQNNSYTSKFKNFTRLDSIHRTKKRTYLGETFYLGKRSSHSFIRIYDKYLESYKIFSYDTLCTAKQRLKDLKNNKNFIRVEIELKQKNADHIFRKLLTGEFDPRSYLYKLIDFKSEGFGRIERRETELFWLDFLDNIDKESLGLPKSFWSLETLEKWIDKQLAPTLYGYTKYKSEKELIDLINNSKDRFTETKEKKFKKAKLQKGNEDENTE